MNQSTNTYDWFFAPTRIKADSYQEDTRAFASKNALTRQTLDTTAGCSSTLNPAAAVADQPGLIARGGFGSAGGCKIDENTELKWGLEGAHRQKGPKQLWARPFATTPFMGGGEPQAVDSETSLLHFAPPRNRKEASTIMDKAIPNFYQPLIPSQVSAYKDVNHWVEQWTRGGDASRLIPQKRVSE